MRWQDDVEGEPGWLDARRDPDDFLKSEIEFHSIIACDGKKGKKKNLDFLIHEAIFLFILPVFIL